MSRTSKIFAVIVSAVLLMAAGQTIRNATIVNSTGFFLSLQDTGLTASSHSICTDTSSNLITSNCEPNGGILTGGSCTTAASAFASCISTVTFFRTEPDTNYAISCTGSGITGWPYILGITGGKGTTSVSVEIGNGSAAAAVASQFSEIDCVISR